MRRIKRKQLFLSFALFLAIALGLFLVLRQKTVLRLQNNEINKVESAVTAKPAEEEISDLPKSPISGLSCENAKRRPLAVMLSSDTVTRPLSGLGQADLVFEMQVVEGSITRIMAVFVCESPQVIGSVRSARHDFIPLAAGLDAVYAHWGGSHFALDKLKTGVIDNLDAMPNLYDAFYRKSGIAMPHNGFTSATRLQNAAQKHQYRLEGKFEGYFYLSNVEVLARGKDKKILRIEYPGEFRVGYEYDPETGSYFRFRGGLKEMDKNINKQVEAKNIIIMRAKSRPLEGDYNEVEVEGQGQAEFYLNGEKFSGIWKKNKNNIFSKLYFYDDKGQEVKFVPGSIWVEIVDPGLVVNWQ